MSNDEPIISTLFDGHDEESREQIQVMLNNFTQNWLPEKQQEINDRLQSQNWESVRECIHAVKGTAGGYGYMELTDLSKTIEDEIKSEKYDNLLQLIDDFNEVCARVYAGNSKL